MAKQHQFVMSRTAFLAVLRPLRRAADPRRSYPLPDLPRLAVGRLETLLDTMEAGRGKQRAVWLLITEREASTFHSWVGLLNRQERNVPGSAMAARARAGWLAGLD